MSWRKTITVAGICLTAAITSCSRHDSASRSNRANSGGNVEKIVNLYIWSDYISPEVLSAFEKRTGVRVNVTNFESEEVLEARMLTGHSNFDVVVPGVANIRRQILAGAYTSLDKQRLPNLANLDEGLLETVAPSDPGNSHAAIYMWGTYGLGYNADMLEKLLPGAALDTWKLIFDPAYAKKLSGCGISLADDPAEIIRIVLLYLGKDPATPRLDDLPAVEKALKSIRPFVRNISSSFNMDAMAQGEACIAVGYNGGFLQALQKVNESGNHVRLKYVIPKEGSLLWVDLLAIPRDAPHPDNAYQFINYLLEPEVTAKISDAILYANANKAALPLQRSSIATNPVIYPDAEDRKRLFLQTEDSPELARAITLLWQTFKSGQ